MHFVLITGPPAVGKMTVGESLAERTGMALFHNHMSIEFVHQFFEFGTKEFRALDREIRFSIFETVAKSKLKGLIFTFVWAFDDPSDKSYVDEILSIFRSINAHITIVELFASLEERLIRNEDPSRLAAKPSKRDLARSKEVLLLQEQKYRMNSYDDEFPEYNILRVDNTRLSPYQVVDRIFELTSIKSV